MSNFNLTFATANEATPVRRYRHDPYSFGSGASSFRYCGDSADATPRSAVSPQSFPSVPLGTLHTCLWGRVSFVPYPDEEFIVPPHKALAAGQKGEADLVRVFIGQMPYGVTDMQLSWLCYTFGGFNVVAYPERIMKRQPNGERLPTGCIHAYASEHAIEEMAAGMHKRMLVDDTGVWHAQSDEELQALTTYIASMKSDKTKRVPGRPYDTVVIQMATSTFVPRHVANKPHLAANAVSESADVFTRPARPAQPHHTGGRPSPASGSTYGANPSQWRTGHY